MNPIEDARCDMKEVTEFSSQYDLVILGAGLAGNSLCRHLLMSGYSKRILLLDNKFKVPGKKQKVGESLVQVGGYYFSKVLDLEEHLFRKHYLKYNLRFYWRTGGANQDFEDFSQSYIRELSNVCSYQLDRNVLEAHMLELNRQAENVTFFCPALDVRVTLGDGEMHAVRFKAGDRPVEVRAEWVIDTSGRGQHLKRRQKLAVQSRIRHGASWCWVDGLVNIEKLTSLSLQQMRTKPDRRRQGMVPLWLATNHFCGEGFWFWVIPLQGLTSLGLVYEKSLFDADLVSTPEKLIDWACREFPLFERDLRHRKILDAARLLDYAYDCKQTIDPAKWAMSGMAGRFTDPLYSPGSDLISFYNTMIVDAVFETDPEQLKEKCARYESLMKVFYEAYVPSYAVSYDALGDQEAFSLKYSWELAIYFSFYVFPFINDLFTNARFIHCFFRKFAQLGAINRNLQGFLSAFYWWKKSQGLQGEKVLFDFREHAPLDRAAQAFYDVGVSVEEAEELLDGHLKSLKEFARFIYAYVASVVIDDPSALVDSGFVRAIPLKEFRFDPAGMRAFYETHRSGDSNHRWNLNPWAMESFRTARKAVQRLTG
jgi:flavin-dependent dehydrogenase